MFIEREKVFWNKILKRPGGVHPLPEISKF
jgi:hypothetical protein